MVTYQIPRSRLLLGEEQSPFSFPLFCRSRWQLGRHWIFPVALLFFLKAEILSREHPASAPPFLITVSTSRLQQKVRKDVVVAAQAPRGRTGGERAWGLASLRVSPSQASHSHHSPPMPPQNAINSQRPTPSVATGSRHSVVEGAISTPQLLRLYDYEGISHIYCLPLTDLTMPLLTCNLLPPTPCVERPVIRVDKPSPGWSLAPQSVPHLSALL